MSVGQELQQAREARQLSVERLADITKLKPSTIHALEHIDVDALPPMVYVVGYLRVMAAELKLDGDVLVEHYVAEVKVEQARAEAARLQAEEARLRAEEQRRMEEQLRAEEAARAEAQAQAEAARAAEEIARLQRQLAQPAQPIPPARAAEPAATRQTTRLALPQWVSAFHWPRIALPPSLVTNNALRSKPLVSGALAVVVLCAIAAFYPTAESASASAARVAVQAEAQAQPQPDAVPAAATPSRPPLRAEIVLTKPAFVSASADGRSIVSRNMVPGERTMIEARTRAVLRVSDPSAVTVSVDGQPPRPLGNGNRSATFEVTRDTIRNFVDP